MGKKISDLVLLALVLLLGQEGRHWVHYGGDGPEWWAVRLWTRRN